MGTIDDMITQLQKRVLELEEENTKLKDTLGDCLNVGCLCGDTPNPTECPHCKIIIGVLKGK